MYDEDDCEVNRHRLVCQSSPPSVQITREFAYDAKTVLISYQQIARARPTVAALWRVLLPQSPRRFDFVFALFVDFVDAYFGAGAGGEAAVGVEGDALGGQVL